MFNDLTKAKEYAKENAPKTVNVSGYNLKFGVVELDTPIGVIYAVVTISGTSGLGKRKPTVSVIFKDPAFGRHSQNHLQKLIDDKLQQN